MLVLFSGYFLPRPMQWRSIGQSVPDGTVLCTADPSFLTAHWAMAVVVVMVVVWQERGQRRWWEWLAPLALQLPPTGPRRGKISDQA